MKSVPGSEAWLAEVLAEFDCQTGTTHRATRGELLELVAAIGVPESLRPKIEKIPFGKGIAGVAAARREPVELCNLQQDLGGVARDKARQTQVAGSLAVPVLAADGERVLGTLGIGKQVPHVFGAAERQALADRAAELADHWEPEPGSRQERRH
jgi:putative methionine-R-sulfoxide reductase with GAF domain